MELYCIQFGPNRRGYEGALMTVKADFLSARQAISSQSNYFSDLLYLPIKIIPIL